METQNPLDSGEIVIPNKATTAQENRTQKSVLILNIYFVTVQNKATLDIWKNKESDQTWCLLSLETQYT